MVRGGDIARQVSSETRTSSFVDDTRVARGIASIADLTSIYQWAAEVNMVFNAEKFECLRFWPGKSDQIEFDYLAPDGSKIEEKDSLRDLGVQISNDLKFNEQIINTVSECRKQASRMDHEDLSTALSVSHDDTLELTDPVKA